MSPQTPRRPAIAYWAVTGLFSSGMLTSGLAQLAHAPFMVKGFAHLGYPADLLYLLGSWKILGSPALLVPGQALVKEWTYAGFFFLLMGALFSHLASGDKLLLALASWRWRPPQWRLPVVADAQRPAPAQYSRA